MDTGKNGLLRRFRKHIIIIYVALIAVVLLTIFTSVFQTSEEETEPQIVWLLAILVVLITLVTMLAKIFKMSATLQNNSARLEEIAEALKKAHSVLTQVNQNTRLSETAKEIAFRDAHIQSLREAVFDKLQQQDFDTTYEIIDEIAHSPRYRQLARQLRTEADKYRDASDAERVNQVITHIDKLLENHQWTKASAQIEKLITAAPSSERAKAMRQKLLDKKQERKKILLNAWDDAVKRQDIDRSLEILMELDMYLTPNEGLALQEAARDVFRNKLHKLGVQFALAVSGKEWNKAYRTGRQITSEFPNSKMAEEIREKIDILREKIRQQNNKTS